MRLPSARWLSIPYTGALVALVYLLTPEARLSQGLGPPPWGPWRLVALHLSVSIPLGFWIATLLPPRFRQRFLMALCLGALLFIGLSAACGELLDQSFLSTGVDFPVRCLWRTLLATVVVFPVCVCALDGLVQGISKGYFFAGAAGLFCLIPPTLFAWAIGSSTLSEIGDSARQGRVTREIELITRMGDLRGADWGGRVRPAMRLAALYRERNQLEGQLKQASDGLDRAALLARLDRLEEALVVLKDLAATDSEAALLRCAILRAKEDWRAAAESYLNGINAWEQNKVRPEMDWAWIEGAGQSLRMTGNNRERENLFCNALTWFPDKAGECHLEIGCAAAESGYSNRALRCWLQAESENPRLSATIHSLRARLLSNTPTCLQGIFGTPANH